MFRNTTIAQRLHILAGLPLLILLCVSVATGWGMRSAARSLEQAYADSTTNRNLTSAFAAMARLQVALTAGTLPSDPQEASAAVRTAEERASELKNGWINFTRGHLSPEERVIADKLGKDVERLLDTIVPQVISALRTGDRQTARSLFAQTETRNLRSRVSDGIEELTALQERGMVAQQAGENRRAAAFQYGLFISFLMALVAVIGLSWRTQQAVVKPVRDMQSVLHDAQLQNDLTQRVEISGKDEIADMGRAFNALMAGLQGTLNRVRAEAEQVASAAIQMAAASGHITESSRAQSASAASTAAAVEQVTVSINQVAANSRETRGVSEQACQLSSEGEQSARAAADQMLDTAEAVANSMQLIEQLSQRSMEISGIVKVIRDIAEQTNLLALNAAIEAARAGEQGRGFAVVADEVRKLAERTASSTSEISAMIEAIQTEVAHAVENLKENNEQVGRGKSLAEQVAATLARINEGARITMERINDISSAAAEQGTASNDIARNVERIAQMTEETNLSVSQAAVSAEQLKLLASQLHSEVAQFRT